VARGTAQGLGELCCLRGVRPMCFFPNAAYYGALMAAIDEASGLVLTV
jgi:hypothetical protein